MKGIQSNDGAFQPDISFEGMLYEKRGVFLSRGDEDSTESLTKKYCEMAVYSISVLIAARESSCVSCPSAEAETLFRDEVKYNPNAANFVPKMSEGSLICA